MPQKIYMILTVRRFHDHGNTSDGVAIHCRNVFLMHVLQWSKFLRRRHSLCFSKMRSIKFTRNLGYRYSCKKNWNALRIVTNIFFLF